MSDDNKNKELEDALMSEQVGEDFLEDLDSADSDGLDDFINTGLDDESDIDEKGVANDSFEELNEDVFEENFSADDSDADEVNELSNLDSQISELDDELDQLNNSYDEYSSSDESHTVDDEDKKSDKKPFKLNKFHIISGVTGVAALFIVGSKLLPDSSDETPAINEAVVSLPKENLEETQPEININKNATSSAEPEVEPVRNSDLSELLAESNKNKLDDDLNAILKEEKNTVSSHPSDNINASIGIPGKSQLYSLLTKDRKKADGIYVKTLTKDGDIVIAEDQEDNMLTLRVGSMINHYEEKLRVDNILMGGELILLSNGLYIDTEEKEMDAERVNRVAKKEAEAKYRAQKEKELEENQINKMIAAAVALEKEKFEIELSKKNKIIEKNNAVLQAQSSQGETKKANKGTLNQAIDRIEKIESSINEPKQPKLLSGWSINASFKVKKDGFIVNGYLIKNAYGDFHRIIVGDQFENYGFVKGYDNNGKFFIGNYYIL